MSKTPEYVANLLYELLKIDKTTISQDDGTITVVQNGQAINLPINSNSTIRSSISRF